MKALTRQLKEFNTSKYKNTDKVNMLSRIQCFKCDDVMVT